MSRGSEKKVRPKGILVELSLAEILDKLSILGIKERRMKEALGYDIGYLQEEYQYLLNLVASYKHAVGSMGYDSSYTASLESAINATFKELVEVNEELWNLENEIEDLIVRCNRLDAKHVDVQIYLTHDIAEVARKIRVKNRERARIKQCLSKILGQSKEEKLYGSTSGAGSTEVGAIPKTAGSEAKSG